MAMDGSWRFMDNVQQLAAVVVKGDNEGCMRGGT